MTANTNTKSKRVQALITMLQNHAELTDRTGTFWNCWEKEDYMNLFIEFNFDTQKCIKQINAMCDVYNDRLIDAQFHAEQAGTLNRLGEFA
jgi:hypothetical protein